MMKMIFRTLAVLALCLLGACTPNDDTPPKPKLFEQERNALEKSKAVDAAQQQQSQEQKEAIDKLAQ
jgi:outer membrane biogenesis lipoprotein LolB